MEVWEKVVAIGREGRTATENMSRSALERMLGVPLYEMEWVGGAVRAYHGALSAQCLQEAFESFESDEGVLFW